MQETLIEKKTYNDPNSTLDKLKTAAVKKLNNSNHHQGKSKDYKFATNGDADLSHDSIDQDQGAKQFSNKKEKKDKDRSKQRDSKDRDESSIKIDATDGKGERRVPTPSEMVQHRDNELKERNGDSDRNVGDAVGSKVSSNDNTSYSGNEKEKKNGKSSLTSAAGSSTPSAPAALIVAAAPPPPIMRGTLSLDLNGQRHLIRGMWNYENSTALPPQRFELVRNLHPNEDKTKPLPVDGVFNGSFSLAYLHMTSKGKQKERSKVIQETGVDIKFTPIPGKVREYKVEGRGTNQFGIFHISGTAEPSSIPDDPTLSVVLRKRYEIGDSTATASEPVSFEESQAENKVKNNTASISTTDTTSTMTKSSTLIIPGTTSAASLAGSDHDNNNVASAGPLPEPTKSFPTGVVALRGTLYKEDSTDLGLVEVVHRINGMWAAGLDIILADPQNVQGFCNRFEYEHKTSTQSAQFPVSGRYSGWFELSNEDSTRTRINERDVTLKFRLNNAGYHNIEGKGSNVFGKYTITGTLTLDNVITIFRVFLPRKYKTKAPTTLSAAPVPGAILPDPVRRPSVVSHPEQKLSLDDVVISAIDPMGADAKEPYNCITPPTNGTYSAVSQGVLRVSEDGAHTCQGKWAVTREHLTNSLTHPFNFRLEPHHAHAAMDASVSDDGEIQQFPLDSAMYKGSFQMKKQGSRSQMIVDQQIVMKFRKNKQGSYNVYGTGINAIGEFTLLGTLVMSGKLGGQVELYRIYKPEKLAAPGSENILASDDISGMNETDFPKTEISSSLCPDISTSSILPAPSSMLRRESSRMSKLPSRLEEDDPTAQLARIMEKCALVLKFIREKDAEIGSYFSEPVDPVKLGIPTYHQVIKEPMDLRTIQRKMDLNQITTPEEFMRLVRLVFENAMTFNIDPAHSVHLTARTLLVKFNEKIKDVERLVQQIRRIHGTDDKDKRKKKDDKKRKRQGDEPKSLKRQRLDEVEEMVSQNSQAIAEIVAAAPVNANASVTRAEFNLLLSLLKQLHGQIIQTHTALAELSPGDPNESTNDNIMEAMQPVTIFERKGNVVPSTKPSRAPSPTPTKSEEKKPIKRKIEEKKPTEPVVTDEDASPLSLEEQKWLTDTISELPQEHLGGVIQIIREAAPVVMDDEEIDIEIDQLDHRTQRNLMKHVSKFVKKSKPKPKKQKQQLSQVQQPPSKMAEEKTPPGKKQKPLPKEKPTTTTDALFKFGGKDSSDSDSGSSEDEGEIRSVKSEKGESKNCTNNFNLNSGLGELQHDDDDDLESDGFAGNWNISDPASKTDTKNDEEKDDFDWAAGARELAAASKARDADRKAREEKKKKETEEANKKAMAEAAKRKEELLAKQADEKEQQEKDALRAREAAREQARLEAQSIEQTVDFDAQREIMKQFDQSFLDNESMGGASPSSDFEF